MPPAKTQTIRLNATYKKETVKWALGEGSTEGKRCGGRGGDGDTECRRDGARARARSACWNGHTDLGMRLIDLGGDELLLSKAKTGARAATRPSPHPPHHPPASP